MSAVEESLLQEEANSLFPVIWLNRIRQGTLHKRRFNFESMEKLCNCKSS